MIYIIDDDTVMAECLCRNCVFLKRKAKTFTNVIEAINAVDELVPELIFLDILLPGPDGFTFLNELASYTETMKIPIVLVSSLDFSRHDLSAYGVVGFLRKETMLPKDIHKYIEKYTEREK